jgi:hypothetical protein
MLSFFSYLTVPIHVIVQIVGKNHDLYPDSQTWKTWNQELYPDSKIWTDVPWFLKKKQNFPKKKNILFLGVDGLLGGHVFR